MLGTFLVCLGYVIVVVDPIDYIVQDVCQIYLTHDILNNIKIKNVFMLQQLEIREGSLLFGLFKKPPLEVFISVYIFNITNLDAFLRKVDAKLKVDEVGPYVYQYVTIDFLRINLNKCVNFLLFAEKF